MGVFGIERARLLATASVLATTVATGALVATPAAAAAAADNSTTVEDLVVTAQRREQSLFEVPAPVTAITGDTLKSLGVTDLKSVMNFVPNAVLPKSPDNYTLFVNIRGIQQVDVQAQPNFGIYRNGFYAGGERPNVGSLVDVDRVEVLAGPQAGLYGRSAVGGAINVVYATPTSKLGGFLNLDAGNLNRVDFQGAANLPVTDTFAVRVAGWYQNQEHGRIYNTFLHTYTDANRHQGGRISAKWTPTQNLSATWLAEYGENRGPSVNAYAPNGVLNLTVTSPKETPGLISRDTPDVNLNHQYYLSQDVKYTSELGTFQWLTSYSDYRMKDTEDQDRTSLDPATALVSRSVLYRREGVKNFYTEGLWFSPEDKPLTFTAGLSYFHQSFDFVRLRTATLNTNFMAPVSSLLCARFLSNAACPGVPGGAFTAIGLQTGIFGAPDDGSQFKTKSYSGFLQAKYKITDKLSISGSLRYTEDKQGLNIIQQALGTGLGATYIQKLYANTFPNLALNTTLTYKKWSPSLEVQYQANENINLYGLYSTGFRPGGFNITTTSTSLITYGSESAKNFEAGVKTRWMGGRVTANLGVFLMNQHNLLTYQPDPIAPPEFFFFYLDNAGSDRTYGVEFSGTAKLTDWWSTTAAIGWEHAKFTGGTSYGTTIENTNLQFVRTWTINLGSQIRYPLGNGYDLVSAANWRHESGGYLDISSIPWESLNRFDGTLGVAKGGASVVAYVNNLTNDRPRQFVYGNGVTTLMDGRTYGVRFQYKY